MTKRLFNTKQKDEKTKPYRGMKHCIYKDVSLLKPCGVISYEKNCIKLKIRYLYTYNLVYLNKNYFKNDIRKLKMIKGE